MNWLTEQYEKDRRAEELRAAMHKAEINALLEEEKRKTKPPRRVHKAVRNKLIQWRQLVAPDGSTESPRSVDPPRAVRPLGEGERLQEPTPQTT